MQNKPTFDLCINELRPKSRNCKILAPLEWNSFEKRVFLVDLSQDTTTQIYINFELIKYLLEIQKRDIYFEDLYT